jgi:spermidine/putrescine transport system ATP-binding protein
MTVSELARDEQAASSDHAQAHALPDTAPVAVSIQAVRKSYDSVLALDRVDLDIRRGEFFSLLGPSGCGKTTLLRIIGGFEDLDFGQVLLDGEDCSRVPAYARNTNMIFQNLALFPHMDVFENVAFGLRRKKVAKSEIKRRVHEALALVRLDDLGHRAPDQLSGGQRQRVAMARAIVNNPSVLLLDEPLGALDLQLRLKMQEELRRLHRALGNTFIFVTHDQGEAMAMSDRIAIMNHGRIHQVGTPENIYERPLTRFVAAFVGHTNLIEGEVEDVRARGTILVRGDGVRIPCRAATSFAKGEKVTVAIRYERVELAMQGHDSQEPIVMAKVIDRTYMGTVVRLRAQVSDALVITADVGDIAQARHIAIGDTIRLTFAEDSAVAVTD